MTQRVARARSRRRGRYARLPSTTCARLLPAPTCMSAAQSARASRSRFSKRWPRASGRGDRRRRHAGSAERRRRRRARAEPRSPAGWRRRCSTCWPIRTVAPRWLPRRAGGWRPRSPSTAWSMNTSTSTAGCWAESCVGFAASSPSTAARSPPLRSSIGAMTATLAASRARRRGVVHRRGGGARSSSARDHRPRRRRAADVQR